MTLALGLALALLSTLALNFGWLLQHRGARDLPPIQARHALAAVGGFLHRPSWLLGFVLGLGGWGLYVAALTLSPLSLVQTTAAAGVAVLAVLAVGFFNQRLARIEWLGVGLTALGLSLLAASLVGGSHRAGTTLDRPVLAGWIVIAIGVVAALLYGRSIRHTLGFASAGGLAAGVLYGTGDVMTKALLLHIPHGAVLAHVLASPYLYATLASHTAAFWILQRAFQLGGPVTAVGLMTSATNVLPIVAGVAIFDDPLPHRAALVALRVAAFVLVVIGATLLARITAETAQGA
jgi:drug/metabolite transporter (DMT)-like permease